MPHTDQPTSKNLLFAAVAAGDYVRLQPYFERVRLGRNLVLVPANAPVEHVYFPEDGVVSIVSNTPAKGRTEVGIFGREGVSATFLLHGATDTPHESFVQVPGASALRIDTARFVEAVEQSVSLRTVLLRYVQSLMIQTAQCAASNAHQPMEARLARWLLMCHDRLEGDDIELTHEFMGMMIAAQRSGVTICLHNLEGEGMIRASRGRVFVRDRAKLLALAGDGYGVPEGQYSKLVAPFGKRTSAISAPEAADRRPEYSA